MGVIMTCRSCINQRLRFCFVITLGLMAQLAPAAAFEDEWRDRRLETPIGLESTGSGERAIGFRRDEDHRRIETNSIYGSTLATAIGNQINVEAAVGSSVVINGSQYNKGNQLAVTVISDDPDDLPSDLIDDFQDRN